MNAREKTPEFELFPETSFWHSGLYVLEESFPCLAVVVVRKSHSVCEVSVFDYNYVGSGDCYFSCYSSLVWPIGSDRVFRFKAVDVDQVEFQEEVPLSHVVGGGSLGSLGTEYDAREVADFLCPLLPELIPLSMSDLNFESLVEGREDFEVEFPALFTQETPNFWGDDYE